MIHNYKVTYWWYKDENWHHRVVDKVEESACSAEDALTQASVRFKAQQLADFEKLDFEILGVEAATTAAGNLDIKILCIEKNV